MNRDQICPKCGRALGKFHKKGGTEVGFKKFPRVCQLDQKLEIFPAEVIARSLGVHGIFRDELRSGGHSVRVKTIRQKMIFNILLLP